MVILSVGGTLNTAVTTVPKNFEFTGTAASGESGHSSVARAPRGW